MAETIQALLLAQYLNGADALVNDNTKQQDGEDVAQHVDGAQRGLERLPTKRERLRMHRGEEVHDAFPRSSSFGRVVPELPFEAIAPTGGSCILRRASWVEAPLAAEDTRPSGFGLPRTPLRVLSMGRELQQLSLARQYQQDATMGSGTSGPQWDDDSGPDVAVPRTLRSVHSAAGAATGISSWLGAAQSLRRRALGAGPSRTRLVVSSSGDGGGGGGDGAAASRPASAAAAAAAAASAAWASPRGSSGSQRGLDGGASGGTAVVTLSDGGGGLESAVSVRQHAAERAFRRLGTGVGAGPVPRAAHEQDGVLDSAASGAGTGPSPAALQSMLNANGRADGAAGASAAPRRLSIDRTAAAAPRRLSIDRTAAAAPRRLSIDRTPAAATVVRILWPSEEEDAPAAGSVIDTAPVRSVEEDPNSLAVLHGSAPPPGLLDHGLLPSPARRMRAAIPAHAAARDSNPTAAAGGGGAASPWGMPEWFWRNGQRQTGNAQRRASMQPREVDWWVMASRESTRLGGGGGGGEGKTGGSGGGLRRRRWWWRRQERPGGGGGEAACQAGGGAVCAAAEGPTKPAAQATPADATAAEAREAAAEVAAAGAAAALHEKLEGHVSWRAMALEPWSIADRYLPVLLPSRARTSWDAFLLLVLLYVAIAVPLQAGFSRLHSRGLEFADWAVLAAFWADMGVQLRTAFVSPSGELVRDSRAIAAQYARTWLALDLVSSVPWGEVLEADLGVGNRRVGALIAVLRVVRLLKLFRLFHLFDRFRYANLLGLLRLFGLTLVLVHWTACVWHGMSEWIPGWPWTFDRLHSSGDTGWLAEYSFALYCSFVLVVGSDNLRSHNNLERGFFILMLVVGAVLYALIISNMAVLAANLNSLSSRYRTRAVQAADALRYVGAPRAFQDRVAEYYDFLAQHEHPGPDADSFLCELPRGLVEELKWALYSGAVAGLGLFAGCDEPFMAALQARLSLVAFTPGEVIYREGEAGQCMYVVRQGFVLLRGPSGDLRGLARAGQAFGTLALLPDLAARRRVETAVAGSATDLVALAGRDLAAVCRDHPESGALVQERLMQQLEDQLYGTQWTWFIEKVLVPYQLHGDLHERDARVDSWRRGPAAAHCSGGASSRRPSRPPSRCSTGVGWRPAGASGSGSGTGTSGVGGFVGAAAIAGGAEGGAASLRPSRVALPTGVTWLDQGEDGNAADDDARLDGGRGVHGQGAQPLDSSPGENKPVPDLGDQESIGLAAVSAPMPSASMTGDETAAPTLVDAQPALPSSTTTTRAAPGTSPAMPILGLVPHSSEAEPPQHTTITLSADAWGVFHNRRGGAGKERTDAGADGVEGRKSMELLRLETATSVGTVAGPRPSVDLVAPTQTPRNPASISASGDSPGVGGADLHSAPPPLSPSPPVVQQPARALEPNGSRHGSRRLLQNLSGLLGSLVEVLPVGSRLLSTMRTLSRGRAGGGSGSGGSGGGDGSVALAASAASADAANANAGTSRDGTVDGDAAPAAAPAVAAPSQPANPTAPLTPHGVPSSGGVASVGSPNAAAGSVTVSVGTPPHVLRRLPRRGVSRLSPGWQAAPSAAGGDDCLFPSAAGGGGGGAVSGAANGEVSGRVSFAGAAGSGGGAAAAAGFMAGLTARLTLLNEAAVHADGRGGIPSLLLRRTRSRNTSTSGAGGGAPRRQYGNGWASRDATEAGDAAPPSGGGSRRNSIDSVARQRRSASGPDLAFGAGEVKEVLSLEAQLQMALAILAKALNFEVGVNADAIVQHHSSQLIATQAHPRHAVGACTPRQAEPTVPSAAAAPALGPPPAPPAAPPAAVHTVAAVEALLSQASNKQVLIALADAVVRREGRSVPAVAELLEAHGREARAQAEAAVGRLLGGVACSVESVELTVSSLDDSLANANRRLAAIEREALSQQHEGVLAGSGALLRRLSRDASRTLGGSADGGGGGSDSLEDSDGEDLFEAKGALHRVGSHPKVTRRAASGGGSRLEGLCSDEAYVLAKSSSSLRSNREGLGLPEAGPESVRASAGRGGAAGASRSSFARSATRGVASSAAGAGTLGAGGGSGCGGGGGSGHGSRLNSSALSRRGTGVSAAGGGGGSLYRHSDSDGALPRAQSAATPRITLPNGAGTEGSGRERSGSGRERSSSGRERSGSGLGYENEGAGSSAHLPSGSLPLGSYPARRKSLDAEAFSRLHQEWSNGGVLSPKSTGFGMVSPPPTATVGDAGAAAATAAPAASASVTPGSSHARERRRSRALSSGQADAATAQGSGDAGGAAGLAITGQGPGHGGGCATPAQGPRQRRASFLMLQAGMLRPDDFPTDDLASGPASPQPPGLSPVWLRRPSYAAVLDDNVVQDGGTAAVGAAGRHAAHGLTPAERPGARRAAGPGAPYHGVAGGSGTHRASTLDGLISAGSVAASYRRASTAMLTPSGRVGSSSSTAVSRAQSRTRGVGGGGGGVGGGGGGGGGAEASPERRHSAGQQLTGSTASSRRASRAGEGPASISRRASRASGNGGEIEPCVSEFNLGDGGGNAGDGAGGGEGKLRLEQWRSANAARASGQGGAPGDKRS